MVETYEIIFAATTSVCLLNILLLGGLIFIYRRGYLELRSRFGLGLIAFAGFLALQNGLYMASYLIVPRAFGGSVVYVLMANSVQTVGLAILSWFSWK